jgi:septum formation protein
MLHAAGVEHEMRKPDVDEETIKAGLVGNDASLARTVAEAKAVNSSAAVGSTHWVIGSDSVVSVGGRRFSKPRDRDNAVEHLRFFRGKTMQLTSAVALARGGRAEWSTTSSAWLRVRDLSDRFIVEYLDAEWPEVSYTVGVFRMEGRGVQLFSSIEGDHFTILGMPLVPLLGALRQRGLLLA